MNDLKRPLGTLVTLATIVVLAGCSTQPTTTSTPESTSEPLEPVEIVLMAHESFVISEELLASFASETGIEIKVLRAGDAGAMVNQAVLTKDNPLADVIFGVDINFLPRALEAGVFEPYESALLAKVPDELEADPRVAPIDFGDVCINWDKEYFADTGLAPPDTLLDLTNPAYRELLVVQSPATSSPGLAFLYSTIAHFGETGDYTWIDYWTDLRDNEVLVTSGWEEAYYSYFTAASDGDRPIVVSYASSPPFEVIYATEPIDEPPTAVMTEGCFRQIEYAGIVTGTEARPAAEKVIDLLLSTRFQDEIPLSMFVFPANEEATLPPAFVEFAVVPADPLSLPGGAVEANVRRWITEWTEVVTG